MISCLLLSVGLMCLCLPAPPPYYHKAAVAAYEAAVLKECRRGRKQETPPEGSLAAALRQAEEEAAAEAGLPAGTAGLLRKVRVFVSGGGRAVAKVWRAAACVSGVRVSWGKGGQIVAKD
jgi:hypothetical protein